MEPLNKLTQEEKNAFHRYVDTYAETPMTENVDYILRLWNKEKNKSLFKLLGEQLIISKPITTTKSIDILKHELQRTNKLHNSLRLFTADIFRACNNTDNFDPDFSSSILCDTLTKILSIYNCAKGTLSDAISYHIQQNDYKLPKGMKISRALAKFLKSIPGAYVEEHYEDFRCWFSTLHNKDTFSGTLCLSIHPLDYITMSDNSHNWSSCMSWCEYGCYRQGTVEMMNSAFVVVAYLMSDRENYSMPGTFTWNSKKWRQLFIINKDMIAGIKGYPYHDTALEDTVLSWLRELAAKNWNNSDYEDIWRSDPDTTESSNYYRNFKEQNYGLSLEFATECMYNDFGCARHGFCFNKNFNPTTDCGRHYNYNLENPYTIYVYDFNYSGETECMSCGQISNFYDDERDDNTKYLCCPDCYSDKESSWTCDECGKTYLCDNDYPSYLTASNESICQHCYDKYYAADIVGGRLYNIDNLWTVNICNDDCSKCYGSFRIAHCNQNRYFNEYAWQEWYNLFKVNSFNKDGAGEWYIKISDLKEKFFTRSYYHNQNLLDFKSVKTIFDNLQK